MDTPKLPFLKNFNGLLFERIIWIYRPNLKSVALPIPEIIATGILGGVANLQSRKGERRGRNGTVRKSVGEFLQVLCTQHSFARNFRLEFWVGVANPILGKRRPLRSRIVPFERAFVTSYRPSIVTFPLSLRVSDILPPLCSSTPLFPTPHLQCSLLEISPCSPESRWMAFGYEERRCWAIVHAVSFQDFQPMCSWSTKVTGQTDDMKSQERALHYSAIFVQWYRYTKRWSYRPFCTVQNCGHYQEHWRKNLMLRTTDGKEVYWVSRGRTR